MARVVWGGAVALRGLRVQHCLRELSAVVSLRSSTTALGRARGPPGLDHPCGSLRAWQRVRCFSVVEQAIEDFGAESITEGTVMEWRKKVGDAVAKGEVIAVVETDKVTIEVNAKEAGTVQEILVKADENVTKGQVLVKIAPGAGAAPAAPAAAAPAEAPKAAAEAPASGGPQRLVEVVVKDFGAESITEGTLMEWRKEVGDFVAQGELLAVIETDKVTIEMKAEEAGTLTEILVKADSTVEVGARLAARVAKAPAAVSVGKGRTERRVPLSPMRQRIIQRMKDTQRTAALLSTFQEADMSAALSVRAKYQEPFVKKHGVPLGLLSLFAKASACALQEVPGVNAVIDDGSKETVYRDGYHISVPIPTPRGPVSCVLPAVDAMSIRDIEYTIQGLMDRAAKDELGVDDMVGATFGIADAGVAGGMLGTGIINPPQSAVLGTNAVTKRAAVVDGKVVARPMMYLSLTYDHRLIDGREAVTFLCSVRDKMEDPSRMLLDL